MRVDEVGAAEGQMSSSKDRGASCREFDLQADVVEDGGELEDLADGGDIPAEKYESVYSSLDRSKTTDPFTKIS